MKTTLLSFLFILTLSAQAQIANGGFEQWDSTYQNVYWYELSELFGIPNPLGGVIDHWVSSSGYGVSQTTDSHAGDYSLILHNWYGYAREWVNYDDAISSRPASLDGFYKYDASVLQGIPQGYATVALTKFNGITNDTIASGEYVFQPAEQFTPFSIGINYTSDAIPDSIHVYVINSDRQCDTSIVCNFLYLDDLTLSGISAVTDAEKDKPVISVYPNPVHDILHIDIASEENAIFNLYDASGRLVTTDVVTESIHSINITSIPSNFYFYNVVFASGRSESGRIVKAK